MTGEPSPKNQKSSQSLDSDGKDYFFAHNPDRPDYQTLWIQDLG